MQQKNVSTMRMGKEQSILSREVVPSLSLEFFQDPTG